MGWNRERGRVNLDWEMEKQDSFHNEYSSIKKKKLTDRNDVGDGGWFC